MPCLDILDVMCAHNSMNLFIYALPWNNFFKVERMRTPGFLLIKLSTNSISNTESSSSK